jgi:hypothetical protein
VTHAIATLAADQAREQRIARDGMMASSELPAMSLEAQAAIEALGFNIGAPVPDVGPAPTVRVFLPVGWTAAPHPLDPTHWWLLDRNGQRVVAVTWVTPRLFVREAGHGTVAVLPPDGLAYHVSTDQQTLRQAARIGCLRCRCGWEMLTDHFMDDGDLRRMAHGWHDMSMLAARHVVICRRMRWALQPARQRAGAPPVLEAVPHEAGDGYLPAVDAWRLPAPPLKPSGKVNWKRHPPSKRRRMRGWQTSALTVKAAYEPQRGWLQRHPRAGTPAWARDPRDPARQPVAVLLPHAVTVTALGATWQATLWALAVPDASVRAAVEAAAAVVVCDGMGGHPWRPVTPCLSWPGAPVTMACARCGCDGVRLPGGDVLTGQDAERYRVATGGAGG